MRSERRGSMIERPTVNQFAPDLRLLWAISAAIWTIALAVSVKLGLPPPTTFWRTVAHEVAGALAGAAFAVLVAAFVFDRLRRAAEVRAREGHEARLQEVKS